MQSEVMIKALKKRIRKFPKHMAQTQILMLGFLAIILLGTLLLTLPISTNDGNGAHFLDALFTATSASCVTGLVVHDTVLYWSFFGKCVILFMIQIGGLGFITIGIFFAVLLRRRIGLKQRELVQESVNSLKISGIVRLVKKIIRGTIIIEGAGAILLAIRFVPIFGFWKGVGYGIFHSISAFCNAGFDLMGEDQAYISFVKYSGDWLVNLTIILLIVIGGIGFLVWDDVTKHGLCFRKYLLHTKIVLVTTIVLLFGGALVIFFMERENVLSSMPMNEKLLASLFSSATARTAGFNTVDVAMMTDGSKFFTMILMFIGGSPGSTAGGIKTTTVIVLLVFTISTIRHTHGSNVGNRRLEEDAIKKASAVLTINLLLVVIAALIITGTQGFALSDVLFEVFSAIGTVGMSTGITRDLTSLSRIVIILLMYCGRIGSLSFALAFVEQRAPVPVQLPVEKINIG